MNYLFPSLLVLFLVLYLMRENLRIQESFITISPTNFRVQINKNKRMIRKYLHLYTTKITNYVKRLKRKYFR